MRRGRWAPAAAAVLAAVTVAGVVVGSSAEPAGPAAPPVTTERVQRGALSDLVSLNGTLTFRARPDGSPYLVVNQAHGTYTRLPEAGDRVACGEVLYRVDEHPVLLLCGAVPVYRSLHRGEAGRDVRQLNRNLRELGYDAGGDEFTRSTRKALAALQADAGADGTGVLDAAHAVVLPEAGRISKVTARLGGPARPGAAVAQATSGALEVRVALDPSQRGVVKTGDRARVTLPGNELVRGRVDRLGRVAEVAAGQDAGAGAATIPASIRLGRPRAARALDRAPVQVDVTTKGVEDALSVPVTALVGKSGGGFAVGVVREGGRRELVAVEPGLFDTTAGRVQVDGDLQEGDRVVVPSP